MFVIIGSADKVTGDYCIKANFACDSCVCVCVYASVSSDVARMSEITATSRRTGE